MKIIGKLLVGLVFFVTTVTVQGREKDTHRFDPNDGFYLKIDSGYTFDQVKKEKFLPIGEIPNLLSRAKDKSIWIKSTLKVPTKSELVFDFIRKDFVNVYVVLEDSLLGIYKTGFLLPSNEKKMGRWNAIDFILEANKDYTFFIKVTNTVNDPDLLILINERKIWREKLLLYLIKDISFLSIILIISIYALLSYFQNKVKGYLYFSMYLFSLFVFYLYILDILRDFFLRSDPYLTLYCVTVAVLASYFYLGFMRDFLNTKKILPQWNRFYIMLGKADVFLFFIILGYYLFTKDYYLVVDVVRFSLILNVILGTFLIGQVFTKRTAVVNYFILGSISMLGSIFIDLAFWTSKAHLGDFSQLGSLVGIGFFSMGLGKKNRIIEKEKKEVQKSYVEQLQINSRLVKDQRDKLEKKVNDRTIALLQAKEEAERNAKAKEEFLSVMSHEIRTPMNAIVGLTHMLPTKNQDKEFVENLTTLRYSVDNLMLLINNVLDYNKISAGKVQLESVDFSLKMIVNSVCHLFKSKADSKGLDFLIHVDEKLPQAINGDPFRLSQILNNFLSNAIKFTEKGAITISVVLLKEEEENANIEFQIIDTGVGIPKGKQGGIFDSFEQVNPDTARKYGGTGLGLAISKDLISLMGGKINVDSEVGVGSKFTFTTTFRKSKESSPNDFTDRNYSKYKHTELVDLSVLIVDDNHLNRMVLKKFMDKWNVVSESAENGEVALKMLKEKSFDLILLDLQMPVMDGYEMAKVMAKDSILSKIPIIAISADTISNVYEKVVKSGMDDFITKPFNPDELKSKIYTHTSKIR